MLQRRMMTLAVAIAGLFGADGVWAQAPASSTGPALRVRQRLVDGDKIRVICFGDSVTGVYYHTGSRRAYTDMLGVALRRFSPGADVEMINAGISGHTTANALARIEHDVIQRHPDLVTVMFGLNDMTRVSLEDYRRNLAAIVSKCRAAGAEVVLATPNNVISAGSRPSDKLVKYCDVVRDVAREMDVALCDVYREFAAERTADPRGWRLRMSDPIHPNMAGHKRIAEALARAITGKHISLNDVPPPAPAIEHTLSLLRDKKTVRVMAMPPCDEWIAKAMHDAVPNSEVRVEPWPVAGLTLEQIEQEAKARVRKAKPDLVLISVPRSARAAGNEAFIHSYEWIMNWSLNFGAPTWDCVVIHPSVVAPDGKTDNVDSLVRRLVQAHDLTLVDRPIGSQASGEKLFTEWFGMQIKSDARGDARNWSGEVQQWGTLREVMHGEIMDGQVRVADVTKQPHMFGIGAPDKLHGEIVIVDSKAWVATIGDPARIETRRESTKDTAVFMAVTQVPRWTETRIARDVSADQVDQFIAKAVRAAGLDELETIPFMIEGRFSGLKLHVLNGQCPFAEVKSQIPGATPPFRTTVQESQGKLIGFYAEQGAGRITHHWTKTHVHALVESNARQVVGHADEVVIKAGSILRLPHVSTSHVP